jgi:hypothetical protein
VYTYLLARSFGTPIDPTEMIIGFSAATILCLASTLVPIHVAVRRLNALEL